VIRVALQRDKAGRPAAIRIQVGAIDFRGLGQRIRGWIPRMPGLIAHSARALVSGVRASVPEFQLRRDLGGRPEAIVLRFGAVTAQTGDGRLKRLHAGLAASLRWLSAALAPCVPHAVVARDEWGRANAIHVRFGPQATAGTGDAGARETADVWVIEPVGSGVLARIQEFWKYRRILKYLAVQAIQRMYVGMNLGILWLFVRPLLPIFISTVVFGSLLQIPSGKVPYFLFFLTGTTCWMLFERSLLWVTRSLDSQRGMMQKMYFPRLLVPVSSVAPAVLDAGTYMGLLLCAGFYYLWKDGRWYLTLGPGLVTAFAAAALSVLLAIGVGLWTSVWQVRVREVRFTLRYVMRFWNYLTPVLYPLSQIPPRYRWAVFLNPMAPLVEAFKWGVIGDGVLNPTALASAVAVIAVTLISGVWYFTHAEAASIDA
jgi:lipopolysaccharide transport system permease protein